MQDHFQSIYRCLSSQRMGKYKNLINEPLDLYKWDIALSESLYPLLHTIEVSFRNRLHDGIAVLNSDRNWLLNRNEQILERLNKHWVHKIDENILTLRKNGKLDEGH